MPIPKLVVTAALMVAQIGIGMMRKIEGPRLDDLKFTGGDYGAPLAKVWGLRRLQAPIFWSEDLREVKRRRKTKGGKFNEYTYYGTWAVAVAGHEIAGVRRIWFDTHLVYDLSGTGPASPFDFGATGTIDDYIAIYLGTESQTADPRMEATVEAAFGEGSCPAYRGTAYVMFKDIPLEKLGNRIPQVSVEVASGASYPTATLTVDSPSWPTFSPDYSVLAVGGTTGYTAIDVAARAIMVEGDFDPNLRDNTQSLAFLSDGALVGVDNAGSTISRYEIGGGTTTLLSGGNRSTVMSSHDGEHWFGVPVLSGGNFAFNSASYDPEDLTGLSFNAKSMFVDSLGRPWVCGPEGTAAVFVCMDGGQFYTVEMGTTSSAVYARSYGEGDEEIFFFAWDGDLFAFDVTTQTIVATYTGVSDPGAIGEGTFQSFVQGASTFWIGFEEIALPGLTRVRLLSTTSWGGSGTPATIYDPINHALITTSGTTVKWWFLDRLGSDGVTLATIAGDVADDCGVEDHDFSALTQTVQGWSATQGQGSNMIEPLLDAYDSDIRPHDFTLQGVKRAGVSGGTILTERFVGDPRYSISIRQAAELPRAVTVTFADVDAEQQPNTARADRPLDATGAVGEQSIDMATWATDADEARQLTDRYFRRLWNERRGVNLGLTAQHMALEPGDCRTLDLDGETDIYRCTRLTVKADGVLATEWKYDHPSLAVIDGTAGANFDGRNPDVIVVPLLSKGFVLDIPLITDADDQTTPAVYIAAAPYASGTWPGAIVYQSVDGEYSDEIGSVVGSQQATWGYADDALPDANPWVWDRGNVVTVVLQVGTLTGTTEAAIDANPALNLALLGDELIQFATATLTATNTYDISGLKRGRRGTEWACSTHAVGDVFLMMDTAQDVAMGLSEVGTDLSFKVITSGRSTAFPINFEPYTGASLYPYAPCQLRGLRDFGTNDWSLSWVRRTRVGGAWTSGTTIPLSEASEEYEVDIMNGSSVVRTFTAASITENGDGGSVTYSSANQVTDFGSNQSAITFRVYQISATVDRGFRASATV